VNRAARRSRQLDPGPDRPAAAPAAASEIPVDKIKVPRGFKVSLWAGAGSTTRAPWLGRHGHALRRSRVAGNVYAVVDRGGRRRGEGTSPRASTCPTGSPSRTAPSTSRRFSRITRIRGSRRSSTTRRPRRWSTTSCRAISRTAGSTSRSDRTQAYSTSARPVTICVPPDTHATSHGWNTDGTGSSTSPRGAQRVGFRLAPGDEGAVFRTPTDGDWLGDDASRAPGSTWREEGAALRASRTAHQGEPSRISRPSPRAARAGVRAAGCSRPAPHVAGQRVQFYTGSMFPPEYRNRIFLASAARGTEREGRLPR